MSEVEQAAQGTTEAAETTTSTEATNTETAQEQKTDTVSKEVETDPTKTEPAKPPEKYDLKMPEGSKLSVDHIEKLSSFAKEKGLSQELAQDLLNRESEFASNVHDAQLENLKNQSEAWLSEIKTDKEFGGDNFAQTSEMAKRAVDAYGDDSIKEMFRVTGVGNHPSFVKMFAKIGKTISNDSFVPSNANEQAESRADILYPTMKQK